MKRKSILVLSMLLIAALLISGCGAKATEAPAPAGAFFFHPFACIFKSSRGITERGEIPRRSRHCTWMIRGYAIGAAPCRRREGLRAVPFQDQ